MSDITKILFRQGTNLVRKLQSVIFDLGEPAFTVDTKRLYIGDGVTIGGIPAGIKNWGTYTPLFSSLSPKKYNSSVSNILSAIEVGDIIYDGTNLTLLYALTASPTETQWTAYNFAGLTLSGYNGVTINTLNGSVSAQLDPTHFTIDNVNQNITINYNLLTSINKNIIGGSNITSTGIVSSTSSNSNSNQWGSSYTTVNSNSANWNSTYTTVNSNSANWGGTGTSSIPYYYTSTLRSLQNYLISLANFTPGTALPGGATSRVIGKYLSLGGELEYNVSQPSLTTMFNVAVSSSQQQAIVGSLAWDNRYSIYVDNTPLSSNSGVGHSGTNIIIYIPPGIHNVTFVYDSDGAGNSYISFSNWWDNTTGLVYISAGMPV